jgi:ABC-2 type transport system permease protein
MTADALTLRPTAPREPSLAARLVGLGSVFGKAMRDGRRAMLIFGGLAGTMMFVGGAAMAAEWDTLESRLALQQQMELLPDVLVGLLGQPVGLETLGGFLSWRFGNIMSLILGLWSVLALSSTLASEARRGTLDFVAASPVARRRIAAQKAGAHVALVAGAMLIASVLTWLATIVFAVLPGDEVSLGTALAHYALTGLLMLAGGGAAFATAPILGRGRALGVGMFVLFGGFLVNAYASGIPILEALRPLSVFSWTAEHRPLAGGWDWAPVIALAGVVVVLLSAGVMAFERRDIGITVGSGPVRLPSLPAGTGGPVRRQLADRLGGSLAWGLGIGLYAFIVASSADAFAEAVGTTPQLREMVDALFPGIDVGEPVGVVQLVFFVFGALILSLAAAGMIGDWAGDEGDGRLDIVLAAPVSRFHWAIGSGVGVLLAIALVSGLIGLSIAVGVLAQGGDAGSVAGATVVLALFGTAVGGVGLLVGGLVGTRFAGLAAGAVAVTWFLLDLLGALLNLPEWVVSLSLNGQLGQPLLGEYDPAGIAASALLTVGGLMIGAWGWTRRDVRS